MRLGFWPAVYGNWIISSWPETRNGSFEDTKQATLLAESLGFKTLLLAEHFMNPLGPELEQLDAWTTASALAAVTERIEIITAVKPGFRAPGVIAKMASNIDHISKGRFALNLVSAWWLPEFEMLGAPVLSHNDRYARSEEFITVIKGMWTQDKYNFCGKYYQVKEATLSPKPVQKPHLPVYVGGESEQGRRLGAKMADVFLINGRPLDEVKEIIQHVQSLAAEYGRCPRFGISAFVICRNTKQQAIAEFNRLVKMRKVGIQGVDKDVVMVRASPYKTKNLGTNGGTAAGLVGTATEIAKRMEEFEEVGVETFLLQFHPIAEEMQRFGDKVLPLLHSV